MAEVVDIKLFNGTIEMLIDEIVDLKMEFARIQGFDSTMLNGSSRRDYFKDQLIIKYGEILLKK